MPWTSETHAARTGNDIKHVARDMHERTGDAFPVGHFEAEGDHAIITAFVAIAVLLVNYLHGGIELSEKVSGALLYI